MLMMPHMSEMAWWCVKTALLTTMRFTHRRTTEMRILLVATTLRTLDGFEVCFERDEDEAILALKHSSFKAVVGNADVFPRFPTRMRDNKLTHPLIMLTLSTNPYMRIRMIRAGANVCLCLICPLGN